MPGGLGARKTEDSCAGAAAPTGAAAAGAGRGAPLSGGVPSAGARRRERAVTRCGPPRGVVVESLILAQDQRWRRA